MRCNPLKSLGDQKQAEFGQIWAEAANLLISLGNLITFLTLIFVHWPKKSSMISRSYRKCLCFRARHEIIIMEPGITFLASR